ncbi:hypothetical protein LTR53_003853 [Teratosphaeriaceae sp. CCFEE 6253]|nr:hypothetical protein LTR53_003853 [Teratosphaeriaceae sp. CCFEE 6253]
MDSSAANATNAIVPVATGTQTKTAQRLLNLPRELRNWIYKLVFTLPPDDDDHLTLSERRFSTDATVLSLLQTCKQINEESSGIFYFFNRLRVAHRREDPLGQSRRASIFHLAVGIGSGHPDGFAKARQVLENGYKNHETVRLYIVETEALRVLDVIQEAIKWSEILQPSRTIAQTRSTSPRAQYVELKMGHSLPLTTGTEALDAGLVANVLDVLQQTQDLLDGRFIRRRKLEEETRLTLERGGPAAWQRGQLAQKLAQLRQDQRLIGNAARLRAHIAVSAQIAERARAAACWG